MINHFSAHQTPFCVPEQKQTFYSVLGIYNFDLARLLLSRKRPNKGRLKYLEKIQDF